MAELWLGGLKEVDLMTASYTPPSMLCSFSVVGMCHTLAEQAASSKSICFVLQQVNSRVQRWQL